MPPDPLRQIRRGVAGANENEQVASRSRSDRDFQDRIICFLADANFRSREEDAQFLDEGQAERAERFSKFLARRYYRDRLQRAFRYSLRLTAQPIAVETIADSPQFDSILKTCVLGSLVTAEEVGRLAVAQLTQQDGQAWQSELLEYEFAFFLQLATSEIASPTFLARKSSSAVFHRFNIRIPELVVRLKAGITDYADLAGEAPLLFSRTGHGKIYVVELDQNTEAVFTAVDGRRSAPEIANSLTLPVDEIQRMLAVLSDIGAVVQPVAPAQGPAV